MIRKSEPNFRVVLYEGSGADTLDPDERYDFVSALLEEGLRVTRPSPEGVVAADDDDAVVLALGRFHDGLPQADSAHRDRVKFETLTGRSAAAVAAQAKEIATSSGTFTNNGWKPWFPVIDYDRCTNCMQCLSFCLFDVYGVDGAEKIEVRNQDKCKTDCPACSRVCPEVAILFPKYMKGPINGDVVREEDLLRESMKVDVSALLGGDIYATLRNRQKSARKRFSTERDESKALLERKRCLKKTQVALDIPDEVLMSLPSVEDIQERAARARKKLERRRGESKTVQDEAKPATAEEWGI